MNRNTKIVSGFLALTILTALFTSCAANQGSAAETNLNDVVDALYKDIDIPAYDVVPLDRDNFEYYAFLPYDDTLTAVEADALVSISAHSMVVIKTDKGNGKDLAETMIQNADPNKWLCVGAEKVSAAYTEDYVVLVMSDADTLDKINENFKAWAKDNKQSDVVILSSDNPRFENYGV